jgi:hypothetical protein
MPVTPPAGQDDDQPDVGSEYAELVEAFADANNGTIIRSDHWHLKPTEQSRLKLAERLAKRKAWRKQ